MILQFVQDAKDQNQVGVQFRFPPRPIIGICLRSFTVILEVPKKRFPGTSKAPFDDVTDDR